MVLKKLGIIILWREVGVQMKRNEDRAPRYSVYTSIPIKNQLPQKRHKGAF